MKNDPLNQVKALNQMLLDGKALEALELFYDDEVSMQENDQAPTVGKAANRQRETDFYSSILELRDAKIQSVAVSGDKTFVEWFYDYTHKDWGKRTYNQVSVQTWKNGKIIHEKFYYGS